MSAKQQLEAMRDEALRLIEQFGLVRVVPADHHRGPRIKVRGVAVNEDTDERGDYVEVELRG